MSKYSFLLEVRPSVLGILGISNGGDEDALKLKHFKEVMFKGACLPPGTALVDAHLIYYWDTTAYTLSTAINRVAKRCEALISRTGLDWTLDPEVRVDGEEKLIDISEEPALQTYMR